MANSNKVTIASTLRFVIDNCADALSAEMLDKLNAMLAQTEKKSANRKAKAVSEADASLMEIVLSVLSDEGKTVTEVMHSADELDALSTPKVTSLLNKLKADGKVNREVVKGKALFTLA